MRAGLIEPLCVAALNTPAAEASAEVFLRILKDALFAGAGSADLLLPRVSLGDALPAPALRWLRQHGAEIELSRRIEAVSACVRRLVARRRHVRPRDPRDRAHRKRPG